MAQRLSDVREDIVTERMETHEPWSVSKVVTFLIGSISVIIGAVGLARTGFEALTTEITTFAGMQMTGLLALLHLVLGAFVLAGATSTLAAKGTLATTGAVLVIAGVIALIEPIEALAWNKTNGVVYLVLGGLALIAGMVTTQRSMHQHSYQYQDRRSP